MSGQSAERRLAAVLGPTNTGKTHYAIERMLGHRDGMIGLPLRLLAREVYDRVVKAKGERAVALITGEEKIVPDTARYFICTVEAMPLDRAVQFVAVDEIQLARDPDRGHIFTHRLLHARGIGETLLLGSDTMRPMLRRLLPGIEISRRERLSTLSYAGPIKLTRLPKRSAIVAFSAEEVYALAELIRRNRGGAAVVMGALSPRTRNAQVALYQSGEVDFLIATDAIGMGLNMDVDHVAFASRAKFDGRHSRLLRADEVAQIAGRAGRFRDDGTFGETGQCPVLDDETIERVESHEFEPVEAIEWRNHALDFSSLRALAKSLEAPAPQPGLVRTRGADDEETLRRLMADDDLQALARRPADVRRAWDVCLTPDFRKSTIDEHARLVLGLATHLLGPRQRLPQDLMAKEVERLDRTDGDLDVLQGRLAHIRTWTYVANRPDWIDDCEHWRGRTRAVEDKLSDALHTLLTQRFIDRRTTALIRGLKKDDVLLAGVNEAGEVTVEGHFLGRLVGLEFKADPRAEGQEERAVRNAAQRALGPEVTRRLMALAADEDGAFALDERGRISWRGAHVGRLTPGVPALYPRVALHGGEVGFAAARESAQGRMQAWLDDEIARTLAPLLKVARAARDPVVPGAARGLAFQLGEHLGALDRRAAEAQGPIEDGARAALTALGVRFGRHTLYVPALLGDEPTRLLAILRHWTRSKPQGLLYLPKGAASTPLRPGLEWTDYVAAGLRPAGQRAVRISALERLAGRLSEAARAENRNDFAFGAQEASALQISLSDAAAMLSALGYRKVSAETPDAPARWRFPTPRTVRKGAPALPSDTPFGALASLAAPPAQIGAGPGLRRRRRRRRPASPGETAS